MTQPRILLAGAGPGIGAAVARRFAAEGFRPALVVRSETEIPILSAGLPAESTFLAADLADPAALPRVLAWLEGLEPEVFLYNASGGRPAPPSSLESGNLEASLQVNLRAPLALTQALLPGFRRRSRGTLLFTGGGLALTPKAPECALSLGKAALRSFALALAEELAPEGLHAATLTVAGFLQRNTPFSPEAVAEAAWALHREPREAWRSEVLLKP